MPKYEALCAQYEAMVSDCGRKKSEETTAPITAKKGDGIFKKVLSLAYINYIYLMHLEHTPHLPPLVPPSLPLILFLVSPFSSPPPSCPSSFCLSGSSHEAGLLTSGHSLTSGDSLSLSCISFYYCDKTP